MSSGSIQRADGTNSFPTKFYSVVTGVDELSYYNFSLGRWDGVVSPATITANKNFAVKVAELVNGEVEQFVLARIAKVLKKDSNV